ncbi:hypothetical protein DQX05_16455 [Paenibacillus thiaminolyticus]|uniref:Uncharacterized protein n=1 Tax=Paenibacillus thiaminolyticus TaxID=49283 RepID=A0A3A3GG32_PANTH|nr:hypothetical protein DQX05_16455 [Paenibacillus thiaminolyticus]
MIDKHLLAAEHEPSQQSKASAQRLDPTGPPSEKKACKPKEFGGKRNELADIAYEIDVRSDRQPRQCGLRSWNEGKNPVK